MIQYSIRDRAAILRLDNPPLNVLSFELLDALTAAIDRANSDSAVDTIVITGEPTHFTSGADIAIFQSIATGEEAVTTSRRFQDAFNHIEASKKPVAAAVAGQVMGGALELALAARYRICTFTARLCFPEVNLGIIPGAGGTQRLPRLIGPKAALEMLLSGRPIDARQALDSGLVDAECAPEALVEAAVTLLQSTDHPAAVSTRTDKTGNPDECKELCAAFRKRAAGTRPEIIAPEIIIDAVERGISGTFSAGLSCEQYGFARCMATSATRNKIAHFFATRATTKIPELAALTPRTIATTAVIGLGSMGCGIAQAFGTAGRKVLLLDAERETAERGLNRITSSLERKVTRGKTTREKADAIIANFTIADDFSALADTDLVIEAVYENQDLKKSLLQKAAAHCASDTIIATNTSTIDLDLLAEGLPHPERLVGIHFFNPADRMPLVEVIRRNDADATAIATAITFTKELRKTPVLVNNRVGFVVNRVFIPYFIEAFLLLEEGAAPSAIDEAMTAFGFPMGPLTLIDMTGIDILAFTGTQMHAAYPYHPDVPLSVATLVKKEFLGQKTGAGVYRYDKGDRTPLTHAALAPLLEDIQTQQQVPPRDITREEITDRLILRMVNESFRVIEEHVALRESDIDVAMVLGTGFPDFRGGITRYAYDTGLAEIIAKLETFSAACGERYQPCTYLLSLHKER